MFSRVAKSVVKSLGQCSYHVCEENLKAIGAAGEFGQTLSQFLKHGSKLESVTVNEVGPITRSAQEGFSFLESKQTMPELTQTRFQFNSKSKSADVSRNSSPSQKEPSLGRNNEQSEDLIDVLKKLPIAEESETANNLQMVPYSLQDGRGCTSIVCCAFALNRGEMGPTRFWNNTKNLKKYRYGLQKLMNVHKCTKSFRHYMPGKKHHLIVKRISPNKSFLFFSTRSPLFLNNFNKQNDHNLQSFSNNQSSIMSRRTIISTLSQNSFFRFISTNEVNLCSKKSSCKEKIEEYCRKLKGVTTESEKINQGSCTSSNSKHPCKKKKNEFAAVKKKQDPCKKESAKKMNSCKKESVKKIDPCKKESAKKIDPCKKESAKKVVPCKKDSTKKMNPCKKESKTEIVPCKKEMPKLDDPCGVKLKNDPRKKESAKKIDPCKNECTTKIGPGKEKSTKEIDPCKKESAKKVDLCKKESTKEIDSCKKEKLKFDDLCEEKSKNSPCKKIDSNKKDSSKAEECPDKKKIESCKNKQCPPVFRAPQCNPKEKDSNKKEPNKKC